VLTRVGNILTTRVRALAIWRQCLAGCYHDGHSHRRSGGHAAVVWEFLMWHSGRMNTGTIYMYVPY
jgi:hypothetical protein